MKSTPDKFSAKETQTRFEAALRGARIAGPKPMKEMSRKRAKKKKKDAKKR